MTGIAGDFWARRRFLGSLCASVVAAGASLPVGLGEPPFSDRLEDFGLSWRAWSAHGVLNAGWSVGSSD